ncbi:MAG TPA: oligosaccharide flippase family protein [Candidatus Thermoplasmatota archaeon]|nr:oligosaccharide flippase family protein [Candidatus Thermoplasmatota archaeon]
MIGRQSALVVGNSVLGAAQGYVTLFVIARYMGDDLLGARAYALSLVYLLGVVCRLGFPITHTRRLARGDDPAASTGAYLLLKLLLTAAFLGLAVTGGWIWFGYLQNPATDTTLPALWMGAFIVVAQSLRDVPVNSFRGFRLILERESVLFANTVVTMAGTVAVAVAYANSHARWAPWPQAADAVTRLLGVDAPMGRDAALFALMLAFLVGEVVALALAYALFLRRRIPVGRPNPAVLRDYVRSTVPLMVLTLGAVLTKRVSEVMLGFWWSAAELGRFAAAAKLSELLLVLASGVTIVLLPVVAELHARQDREGLRRTVLEVERWVSLLVWPIVVFVALHARAILHILLSDDFLPASGILVLLCVHSLVASLRMPLQTKALGLGADRFAGQVALATVAVNILLNTLLIPERIGPLRLAGLGATGAAWAALGSGFVTLLAYRRQAHEWTGHPYLSRHLVLHALAAGATYAAFRLTDLSGLLPEVERFYDLAWSAALVATVYVAALAVLRELRQQDLRGVWALVRGAQTPK